LKSVLLIFVFLAFVWSDLQCQTDSIVVKNDSLAEAKQQRKQIYSSPRKASILSAAMPGLGQIYNRKFWKVPIIYAALGGLSYFFYENNSEYNNFRKAHIFSVTNGGTATVDGVSYLSSDLQSQKFYYKKFRDFSVIGIGIVYLLQIVDANVDAHLKTFDVSDDLSLNVDPWHQYCYNGTSFQTVNGISLKLTFK